MAFPAGYTLLGTLEVPSLAGATAANVPLLLKFEDFSTAMLASLDVGGGDLRISDDAAGVAQLPVEVVSFTKVSGGVQVWVKVPSVSSSTLIYIWGNNTGDAQPAVGAPFGRDAVWVDSETRLHLESNTSGSVDSTGNGDYTTTGTVSDVSGKIGEGFKSIAGDVQDVRATTNPSRYTNTVYLRRTASQSDAFITDIRSTSNHILTLLHWSGAVQVFDGAFRVNLGALTLGAWTRFDFVFDGADLLCYKDSSLAATVTGYVKDLSTLASITVGGSFLHNLNPPNIEIDEYSLDFYEKSADFIVIEYSNQSSVGAWFAAADAPSGGVTGSTAFDLNALTFAGVGTATLPTPTGTVSFELGQLGFTSTGAATLPQPIATIGFDLGSLGFFAVGSNSGFIINPNERIDLRQAVKYINLTQPNKYIDLRK